MYQKQIGKTVIVWEECVMSSLYTEMRREHLTEWRTWYKMIYSCTNNIKYYLETQVCDDWKGPQGFINWFDYVGPRPGPDYVFDRINKLGDYEPGNVQWTSKQTSCRNQRRHQETGSMSYWNKIARQNGIKKHTFRSRVVVWGWDPQDAATLPPSTKKYKSRII